MGLDVAVGLLSYLDREDPEGAEFHRDVLRRLNDVLAEAGQPPHLEPTGLPKSDYFEGQMWGYGGIHHVRRLAAYLALTECLPEPCAYEEASKDPILLNYYTQCDKYPVGKKSGLFGFFGRPVPPPRFAHLVIHSDCEGFYIPRELPFVLSDNSREQREGIGGFVGSSIALASEVRELADVLGIPAELDPEDDVVFENAESPIKEGLNWQRFGVETFVLTRLRRACELSERTGAAIVFT